VKNFLKWAGVSIATVFLAFIAINLFDEGLDPQAAMFGKPRPPKVPDSENGYIALLAMDASDGAVGIAYANTWLDEARAAARDGRRPSRTVSEQAKRPDLCDSREDSCLAVVREKGGQIAQQLGLFTEDLARYEALIAFKRFEEVLDYPFGLESDYPAYASLTQAQRAYLLRVALDFEAGRVEDGIAALERELAWQRLFLTESRMLVSKMVAIASYWRALMFVRNLLETRSAELAPFLPRLKVMLGPLDSAVLSLPRVVEVEFGLVVAAYSKISPDRSDIGQLVNWHFGGGALLYQPNATVNHAYRYYSTLGNLVFGAPAHLVVSEWKAFSGAWHDLPWWRCVYNPIGKILLSVSMPDWNDYALRMHDLDALNRLVALRVELLASGVSPEQMAEIIAASDRRFHDPYTLRPMRRDTAKKRLYFEAGSKRIKELKNGVEDGRVFMGL